MHLKKIHHVLGMLEQKLFKGYWEHVAINNSQFQIVSLFTFNIFVLRFLKKNIFYSILKKNIFSCELFYQYIKVQWIQRY